MLVICLVMSEGFARAYYYVFMGGFQHTKGFIKSSIYGIKVENDPNDPNFNSLSFRGKEILAKQKTRILVVGDSVTVGRNVPIEKTFVEILNTNLPYEVINFGSSGKNTLQELEFASVPDEMLRSQLETINQNIRQLNKLLYGYLDYAIIAKKVKML